MRQLIQSTLVLLFLVGNLTAASAQTPFYTNYPLRLSSVQTRCQEQKPKEGEEGCGTPQVKTRCTVRVMFSEVDSRGRVLAGPSGLKNKLGYRLLIDAEEPLNIGEARMEPVEKDGGGEQLDLVVMLQVTETDIKDNFDLLTAQLTRLLTALDGKAAVGLVAFTDVIVKDLALTGARKVGSEVRKLRVHPGSTNAQLPEAVNRATELLAKGTKGRPAALLLITDGINAEADQQVFCSLGTDLKRNGTVVHILGVEKGLDPKPLNTVGSMVTCGMGSIRRTKSAAELAGFFNQLRGELVDQQVLTFPFTFDIEAERNKAAEDKPFYPFDGQDHDFQLTSGEGRSPKTSNLFYAKTLAYKPTGEAKTPITTYLLLGAGGLVLLALPLIIVLVARRKGRRRPDESTDDLKQVWREVADEGSGTGARDPAAPRVQLGNLQVPEVEPPAVTPARVNLGEHHTRPPIEDGAGQAQPKPNLNLGLPGQPAFGSPPPLSGGTEDSQDAVRTIRSVPRRDVNIPMDSGPVGPIGTGGGAFAVQPPIDQMPPRPAQEKIGVQLGGSRLGVPSGSGQGPAASVEDDPFAGLPSPDDFGDNRPLGLSGESPAMGMSGAVRGGAQKQEMPDFNNLDMPDLASFSGPPMVAGKGIPLAVGSNMEVIPSAHAPKEAPGGGGKFVARETQILMPIQMEKDHLVAWIVPLDDPSFPTIPIRDGFTLGSGNTCDFIIRDKDVELKHAVLDLDSQGYRLRWAAKERNQEAQLLLDGDRFRVGSRQFLIKMALSFSDMPRSKAYVEVLDGIDKGRHLDLEDSIPYAIGSHPSCALVIRGEGVGARHAIALRKDNVCFIEDLGAETGLKFDGAPVGSKGLKHQQEITLGEIRLIFMFEE